MATSAAASSSSADLSQFNISSEDPKAVTAFLQKAAENYHLISPATSVALVPEGCSIATTVVLVDVERETYATSRADTSKLGLGKTALDRISGAAGIVWDPYLSGRVDNGSDPLYCQWRAVGTYRGFDGSPVTVPKNKTVDLRPGSPQAKAMTEAQLPQARQFVMEMAESKAMNRVIRTLGVRTSYTRQELAKPFIVARLMLTGAGIKDPALRREITMMRAASMLGGGSTLYGGGGGGHAQMGMGPAPSGPHRILDNGGAHQAPALGQGEPPPPVGGQADDDDADDGDDGRPPTPGKTVVAFGSNKGRSIDQISSADLEWYATAVTRSVADTTKARYKASNQRVLDACREEQETRRKAPAADEPAQGREPGDDDFG
jgi:hypothetical protein